MVMLWGSNARETHPIFFHHLLKGVHNGARLISVDPRRTSSAQWADLWLGLDVGSDIALANAMAREIIHSDLHNHTFINHATTGFEEYAESRRVLHARGRRAAHRRAGQGHPRGRPRIRARGPGDDLLDARDHRAPQRGGQRPRR